MFDIEDVYTPTLEQEKTDAIDYTNVLKKKSLAKKAMYEYEKAQEWEDSGGLLDVKKSDAVKSLRALRKFKANETSKKPVESMVEQRYVDFLDRTEGTANIRQGVETSDPMYIQKVLTEGTPEQQTLFGEAYAERLKEDQKLYNAPQYEPMAAATNVFGQETWLNPQTDQATPDIAMIGENFKKWLSGLPAEDNISPAEQYLPPYSATSPTDDRPMVQQYYQDRFSKYVASLFDTATIKEMGATGASWVSRASHFVTQNALHHSLNIPNPMLGPWNYKIAYDYGKAILKSLKGDQTPDKYGSESILKYTDATTIQRSLDRAQEWIDDWNDEVQNGADLRKDPFSTFARSSVDMVATNLATIGISALGKNPAYGLLFMGAMASGQREKELTDMGVPRETARWAALLDSLIEPSSEYAQVDAVLKMLTPGKMFKKAAIAIGSDLPSELGTEVWGIVSDSIVHKQFKNEEVRDRLKDTLGMVLINSGVVGGFASTLSGSRKYGPAVKQAANELSERLLISYKVGEELGGGFFKNIGPSVQSTYNNLKKTVGFIKAMDLLANEKGEVNVEKIVDMFKGFYDLTSSYEEKEFKKDIINSNMATIAAKAHIKEQLGNADLKLNDEMYKYFEAVFGKDESLKQRADKDNLKLTDTVFKHFFGDDWGGLVDVLDKFANRYDLDTKTRLERQNLDWLANDPKATLNRIPGYTWETLGQSDDTRTFEALGNWRVQHLQDDNSSWSRVRQLSVLHVWDGKAIIRYGNVKDKEGASHESLTIVDVNKLNFIHRESRLSDSNFDNVPLNNTQANDMPSSFFVTANTNIANNNKNVLYIRPDFTDDNYLENQNKIRKQVDMVKRSFYGKHEMPQTTVEMFSPIVYNRLTSNQTALLYLNGVDEGDLVEIALDGKEPILARVKQIVKPAGEEGSFFKDKKGNWIWKNKPGGTQDISLELAKLNDKKAYKYMWVDLSSILNFFKQAPLTYMYYLKELNDLKNWYNKISEQSLKRNDIIWKNVGEEVVQDKVVYTDAFGVKSNSKTTKVKLTSEARILHDWGFAPDGRKLFTTTLGILDANGNTYKPTEKISNDRTYIALEKREEDPENPGKLFNRNFQIVASGPTKEYVKQTLAVRFNTTEKHDVMTREEAFRNEVVPVLKGSPALVTYPLQKLVDYCKPFYPEVWEILESDKEDLDQVVVYAANYDKQIKASRGEEIYEWGIVLVNKDEWTDGGRFAETSTHEMIHALVHLATENNEFAARLHDFVSYVDVLPEYNEFYAKKDWSFGDRFHYIQTPTEVLSWFLTRPEFIEILKNTIVDNNTLLDMGLSLLKEAIDINKGEYANIGKTIEHVQKVHNPVKFIGRPMPWLANDLIYGDMKHIDAVKKGLIKGSVVTAEEGKDMKIGDVVFLDGGYGSGFVDAKIVHVVHGVVGKLNIDNRGNFPKAANEKLLAYISEMLGFTDFVPANPNKTYKKLNDTEYGKGWIIKGSGALKHVFSPRNRHAFWKNKQCDFIEFELIPKNTMIGIKKDYKVTVSEMRKVENIAQYEYKHVPTKEERRVEKIHKLMLQAAQSNNLDKVERIVDFVAKHNWMAWQEADAMAKAVESQVENRKEPAYYSVRDWLVGLFGFAPMNTGISAAPAKVYTSEVAVGQGMQGGYTKRGKVGLVANIKGTQDIGSGGITFAIQLGEEIKEVVISGPNFNPIIKIHKDSVRSEIQKWIDTSGEEGLDPNSTIAINHFFLYDDLFREFGHLTRFKINLDWWMEYVLTKGFPVISADILSTFDTPEGRGSVEVPDVGTMKRLAKEESEFMQDEEQIEAREFEKQLNREEEEHLTDQTTFTEVVTELKEQMENESPETVTVNDTQLVNKEINKLFLNNSGSTTLLTAPYMAMYNLIKRITRRTGKNPEIISAEIKRINNIIDRVVSDIPKLFNEAQFFGIDLETYISRVLVNNGIPETTDGNSLSAKRLAHIIMNEIIDQKVIDFITREVDDYLVEASRNERTQEYSVKERLADAAQTIKDKAKEKGGERFDSLERFMLSLRFFPYVSEEARIEFDDLFGKIRQLQIRSGVIEQMLWGKVHNSKHRELTKELIRLKDELGRARSQRFWFPYSLQQKWNPRMEGDVTGEVNVDEERELESSMMGAKKFKGEELVKEMMSPDSKVTYTKARRQYMKRQLEQMCLEIGLNESQIELMKNDKSKIFTIADQILGIKFDKTKKTVSIAQNLIEEEGYWDVKNGHELVKKLPSNNIQKNTIDRLRKLGISYGDTMFLINNPRDTVFIGKVVNKLDIPDKPLIGEYIRSFLEVFRTERENATQILKHEITERLSGIRKYNKKYYEPIAILKFEDKDVGVEGRGFEEIQKEYIATLKEFNKLKPGIKKNILHVINTWNMKMNSQLEVMKQIGWLKEGKYREDYAPYFFYEYNFLGKKKTSWLNKRWRGLPKKLKEPAKKYTKTAWGNTRERFLTPESMVDHILNVEYDMLVARKIEEIASKFDVSHFLTDEEREKYYLFNDKGNLNQYAKAGKEIVFEEDRKDEGENVVAKAGRYIFWTPEYFKFQLGTDDLGQSIILDNSKSFLIDTQLAYALNSLALPYNGVMETMNTCVNMWKKAIIYATYPIFNFNNMYGDMQMLTMIHPDPGRVWTYLPRALEFLVQYARSLSGKPADFIPLSLEAKVKAFIDNYSIIEAGEMAADLGQTDITNFPKYIASKLANFAMWREAILRTTNAFYLMDQYDNGDMNVLKSKFAFLGIDPNLQDMDFLGRVGKTLMIDYFRRSPMYRRWITGFMFPWGHFYLNASNLMFKVMTKGDTLPKKMLNFFKKLSLFALPPMAFNFWNYGMMLMLMGDPERAEEYYEYEMSLSPEMRNRLHLIIGKFNGKLVIWTPQYIPDITIGTKFISIGSNNFYRMLAGELSPKQFGLQMLKDVPTAEGKGAAFLTNPLARFFWGIFDGTDPLDGSKIYPYGSTDWDKAMWAGVYFNKVMNPILSTYISSHDQQKMTKSDAAIEAIKRFGWWKNLLGVKEVERKIIDVVPTGKTNLITGKPAERNVTREVREEENRLEKLEGKYMREIKEGFIRSRMTPQEYVLTDEFNYNVDKIKKDVYKGTVTDKQDESFAKRLENIFTDPYNNIAWARNMQRAYKPGSEKWKQFEEFRLNLELYTKNKQASTPVTIRGEREDIVKDIVEPEEGDE